MNGEKLNLTLVSYSSQYSTSYPATNAFDGSTSSYWRTVGSPSYPQNIIVKLDSVYYLSGFKLCPSTSSYRPSSFKIFVSSDGVVFKEIYSNSCSSSSSYIDYEFPNERTQYVKIEFTGYNSSRLYVYEFQLYGIPIPHKYLFRSGSTLYTVANEVLTALDTQELTAETFQTYGVDDFPEWSILSVLVNPEILYWEEYDNLTDAIPEPMTPMTAVQTATPPPQRIISNRIDLTHLSITGIEKATVICEGDVLFAVSFDDKQTWKAWNGTQWSTVSEEFSGMTKQLFESVTYDDWMTLYTGATSFYIKAFLFTTEQSITSVYIDFAN